MEVKKIVEGMTAPQVAQVIDDNFKAQNAILEEDIAKQNNVIGVSEYKYFSEAEAVNVGDVRKYDGLLYECVEATTGAFDASKWKKSSFKAETEKKLAELGSEIGKNYFDESIIGYIAPDGSIKSLEIGVVTPYVYVKSGDKIFLRSSDTDYGGIGAMFGYSDTNGNGAVQIEAGANSIDKIIIIPDGVNYVRAWGNKDKKNVLCSAESLSWETMEHESKHYFSELTEKKHYSTIDGSYIEEHEYYRSKSFEIPSYADKVIIKYPASKFKDFNVLLYSEDKYIRHFVSDYIIDIDLSVYNNPTRLIVEAYIDWTETEIFFIKSSSVLSNRNKINIIDKLNKKKISENAFEGVVYEGYLNEVGKFTQVEGGIFITTEYIDVTEFKKIWLSLDKVNYGPLSCLWGYTNIGGQNPVALVPENVPSFSNVIEIPDSINYVRAWGVKNTIPWLCYADSLSMLLSLNKISPIIDMQVVDVVVQRNAQDYNSIRETIASITDASENKQYIVKVPEGRWFECDIIGKKYVKIVGSGIGKTVLYCDGTSDKLTPSDYVYGTDKSNVPLNSLDRAYKHCIFVKNDIDVSNLSVEVNDAKYCVHLDSTSYKNANFDNCHFIAKDNVSAPFGIGINGGQRIVVTNSMIERTISGQEGIFAHNWNNQSESSYISFSHSYFKNCYFALIDELGSNQVDDWNITDCYSDAGGGIRTMVDYHDGATFWINQNGVKETDARNVPYCINLNCLGSNIKMIESVQWAYGFYSSRPDFIKYIKTDYYFTINKAYNEGTILRGVPKMGGYIIDNKYPILGVVAKVIDGISYVIPQGNSVEIPLSVLGVEVNIEDFVYENNGMITKEYKGNAIGCVSNVNVGTSMATISIWGTPSK